uniref:Vacuolar protein sortingassociated protein putative n=1 Tax=Albugo laibachii Nc14 TaxID=890382 RepID=F0WQI0_9STRA|nr:vacuolar protein sortingassociated protein putative [Albugo laibachii Nc14]|eukprot:CCA23589.1 vacuolar protein sortingassociated protein putative [Albugo laibachii Nc14]
MDSAEWHTLGKVQYQKWSMYDELEWQQEEEVHDIRSFTVAVCLYGGPVALLRDNTKIHKASKGSFQRTLMTFTAAGRKLSQVSWEPYETREKEKNPNSLISMNWTDDVRLLCVFEDGTCRTFSVMGELEAQFSILSSSSDDKIVTCEPWINGIVALTEHFQLIQVSDIDAVRPKVSKLPDCSQFFSDSNPPTCMAIVKNGTSNPEVFLGTSDGSLVIATRENGGNAQDMALQNSIKAPITKIAVAPNNLFLALYTQDGILTVLNTMLDKKILSFDTESKATPTTMCWCGEDSVLLYWPSGGLVMVGPYGSWLRFPYQQSIVLVQEIDCCRIYSAQTHEILIRVASSLEHIKGIGSTAPAAMLFQAMEAYDAGDAKADEHIRFIQSQKTLEEAIKDCIDAGGAEFDYAAQTSFLRAASYGKCFVQDPKMELSLAPDTGGNTNLELFDSEHFVEMCRKLRVLNALRQPNVGFPLTIAEFDRLSAEVAISRLVAFRQHFLALKICSYLKVSTDRVLVHWACEKVKSVAAAQEASGASSESQAQSDDELVSLVCRKLKTATSVSYADIASCAERVNRRRLATMFLDLEQNASDQVPLLLSMGEFELAIRKSIESNVTDLVFMTLFHLERTLPSLEELRYVLYRDPVMYKEAIQLLCLYYQFSKATSKLEVIADDNTMAHYEMLQSFRVSSQDSIKHLREAMTRYNSAKNTTLSKLVEEEIDLRQEQEKLEDRSENVKRRTFVGLSVSATLKLLVKDSKHEAKLLNVASQFAKKFKIPEKRMYRVKIQALAETRQWDALQKFSQERKTPPCGFKAFAVVCLAQGDKNQAEAYTARITAVDEKFETLIHLEMYQDALQVAIKQKDPEKLTNVRNLCGDPAICQQADQAAVELGFIS